MEKILEFNNLKEFSVCKEITNKIYESLKIHYDRDRKKYITTIEYGKK